MSLAEKASHPINYSKTPILCHVATWFYAAQEAQGRGLSPKKSIDQIMLNIASIPEGSQNAILALGRSATWDFKITPTTPMDGTVLLWLKVPTHSAIVSKKDGISGYNQVVQWPGSGTKYSTNSPKNISPNWTKAVTILENTIVTEAGRRGL